MFTSGHLSEPTTPPEYYSSVNRVHSARLSTASLASPPGFPARPSRPGSQLASPQATFSRPVTSHVHSTSIPSRSVPASRRGSDEDDEETSFSFADINHRAAAKYVQFSILQLLFPAQIAFSHLTIPPDFDNSGLQCEQLIVIRSLTIHLSLFTLLMKHLYNHSSHCPFHSFSIYTSSFTQVLNYRIIVLSHHLCWSLILLCTLSCFIHFTISYIISFHHILHSFKSTISTFCSNVG